jgi:hypothetical protein
MISLSRYARRLSRSFSSLAGIRLMSGGPLIDGHLPHASQARRRGRRSRYNPGCVKTPHNQDPRRNIGGFLLFTLCKFVK